MPSKAWLNSWNTTETGFATRPTPGSLKRSKSCATSRRIRVPYNRRSKTISSSIFSTRAALERCSLNSRIYQRHQCETVLPSQPSLRFRVRQPLLNVLTRLAATNRRRRTPSTSPQRDYGTCSFTPRLRPSSPHPCRTPRTRKAFSARSRYFAISDHTKVSIYHQQIRATPFKDWSSVAWRIP